MASSYPETKTVGRFSLGVKKVSVGQINEADPSALLHKRSYFLR
jgi:hypothetical protein